MRMEQSACKARANFINNNVIPVVNQAVKYKDIDLLVANAPWIVEELMGFAHVLEVIADAPICEACNNPAPNLKK